MKMQARPTRQKRLHILSDDEIEALYGRPRFTPEEQLEYFTLSPREKAALEPFHSIKSRIYGILQLGAPGVIAGKFTVSVFESPSSLLHV
jgi:hypothetical protein